MLLHMQRADVMATTMKVWRHITKSSPSTDAYLLEEKSFAISSLSDLKQQSQKKKNKMISYMESVPNSNTAPITHME